MVAINNNMNISEIIRVPYNTLPYMIKNKESFFIEDPDPYIIAQKKHQLNLFWDKLFGITTDAISNQVVRRVSAYLDKPITGSVVELALNFEEDVAILHKGVLSAICFCFPSSWVPCSAIGKTLEEIHRPVADGEKLRAASNKISNVISSFDQGSFRRHVWTITKVPSLSNYVDIVEYFSDEELDINTLFFRTETQTTVPLPGNDVSVFFVKVDVVPLLDIWNMHKLLIMESLNSMSDNVIRYKNLSEIKKYLNSII
jgi:hypothetical protein